MNYKIDKKAIEETKRRKEEEIMGKPSLQKKELTKPIDKVWKKIDNAKTDEEAENVAFEILKNMEKQRYQRMVVKNKRYEIYLTTLVDKKNEINKSQDYKESKGFPRDPYMDKMIDIYNKYEVRCKRLMKKG